MQATSTEADGPPPRDAIAAATHPAPYAWYADLARRPLARDPRLGLWIAASASAVMAVLADPCCRVRAPVEPVPAWIAGTTAGALFARMVRMTDGDGHARMKAPVRAAIAGIDMAEARSRTVEIAHGLCARLAPADDPAGLTRFCFRLPVHVVASLLGIPSEARDAMADWIDAFIRCLAPGADAVAITRGADAAAAMADVIGSAVADGWAGGLLARLADGARAAGIDDPAPIAANAVGLMMQSCEATAGLIGNTLLAAARHGIDAARLRRDARFREAVVREVLRHDPPIHNTRRFVAEAGIVAGTAMAAGDAILVVLAAANRDAAVDPAADHFDPLRTAQASAALGHGRHSCPGGDLAVAIAAAGVQALLAWGIEPLRLAGSFVYRPAPNARIPIWGGAA